MAPRRVSIGSTDSTFDDSLFEGSGTRSRSSTSGGRSASESTPFDGPGFRRFLLVVVVAALAALPLATAAIAIFVDTDEVTGWLEPRLSAALNRDVTVGDAGIALLPRPGLRLSDVRVGGGSGSDLPSVASVRDVHLEAAILPLFTGRVAVDRVRMSGLDVHLEVSESGASNFGDLVPESRIVQTARQGPVAFAVSEVTVDGVGFTYFDGVRDRSFAISGGAGSLDLRIDPDGSWSAAASGSADSLLIRAPGLTDEIVRTEAPGLRLTIRGDEELDRLEVTEGTLEHRGQTLDVEGHVEGISAADPRVDLRFSNEALDLGVLTAFLPQTTRARSQPALQGTADVRLTLRGGLRGEGSPALRGSLGLSDAGLLLAGEAWITDIDGDVRLRDETVELDSITGSFADGPFALSATFHRESRRMVGTVQASPDVDDFQRLGLTPYGFTMAGGAEMAFDVAGPVSAPDSLRVTGSVLLTGLQAEHEGIGVPLYLPSGSLHMDESSVEWSDLTLLVGTDPLLTSGRMDRAVGAWLGADVVPVVEGSVSGERLDLRAVFPEEPDAPEATYARIVFAHLGGRALDGMEAGEVVDRTGLHRPEDLPMHGTLDVSLEELAYRTHDLRDVRARVILSDSTLTVEELEATAWDGTVTADLDLGIGARVDEPFTLTFRARDVDAVAFLGHMTPVGDAVSGRLDLSLDVRGTTDRSLMPVLASLDGTVETTVTDGTVEGTGINLALADFLAEERWRSLSFSTWRTEMALEEEMFRVVDSRLEGDAATAKLSGAVGLGGAVDLAMALSIPPDRLRAISLRRTGVAQTVLDRLTESESPLDLGIRISGTLQGPTLEPDALAASEGGGR